MENVELLRKIYIFQDLNSFELISVNKLIKSAKYSSGDIIINRGDPGESMYILKKGKVLVYITDESNQEEVLATLEVGDHFGEIALLDDGPRSASVRALEDTETIKISRPDFDKLLSSKMEMANKLYKRFIEVLCTRLRNTNESLIISLPYSGTCAPDSDK
jgi:CRP-like cAMP-binding protein